MATTRTDVTFGSGGERCAAYLYPPVGGLDPEAPVPCVVMAHGFSATRDDGLPGYAKAFAEAGFAALVFDYRHFGSSSGQPRQVLDVPRQLDDYRAAIAFARATAGIDPDQIALWGSSFSGGHVITLGAEDRRIAAIVAQAPYVDSLPTIALIPPKNILRGAAEGIFDLVGSFLGRPAHYIAAVAPPGGFAVITQPQAVSGFEAIVPHGSRWENRVAARIMVTLPLYRPVRKAAQVAMPLLVSVCDRDEITPPEPAAKVAELAPRGELLRYDVGHFDIYDGDQPKRDQVAFLSRHLSTTRAATPS